MYITPNIIEVKPLEDYFIYLKFEDGTEKIYDVKNEINLIKSYEKLKDKLYFSTVKTMGTTVVWENGEDIAPENLYYKSITLEEFKKR